MYPNLKTQTSTNWQWHVPSGLPKWEKAAEHGPTTGRQKQLCLSKGDGRWLMTEEGVKVRGGCHGWSTSATTSPSPWAQFIRTSSSTRPQITLLVPHQISKFEGHWQLSKYWLERGERGRHWSEHRRLWKVFWLSYDLTQDEFWSQEDQRIEEKQDGRKKKDKTELLRAH